MGGDNRGTRQAATTSPRLVSEQGRDCSRLNVSFVAAKFATSHVLNGSGITVDDNIVKQFWR